MKWPLMAIFFLTIPTLAHSTTYYVATTAIDSKPGTQTQPFQTIQKAANIVKAGDTVYVADGTYMVTAPGGISKMPGYAGIYIPPSAAGTSSQRTRFISQNRWGAKVVS